MNQASQHILLQEIDTSSVCVRVSSSSTFKHWPYTDAAANQTPNCSDVSGGGRASLSDLQKHKQLSLESPKLDTCSTCTLCQHQELGCINSQSATHYGNLAGLFTGSDPQLVDSRLCDIGPFLGLVQLMLDFPETHCIAAHLLFLVEKQQLGFSAKLVVSRNE